jgi:hypothetical protein
MLYARCNVVTCCYAPPNIYPLVSDRAPAPRRRQRASRAESPLIRAGRALVIFDHWMAGARRQSENRPVGDYLLSSV